MFLRPFGSPRDPEKDSRRLHGQGLISRCISMLFCQESMENMAKDSESAPDSHVDSFTEPSSSYSAADSDQASAKLWNIYVGEADRYDTALVESWKADMEGMLIFSGLFSASLTAFLIESYRTLQPDAGDTTARLLAQISQQLVAISNNTVLVPPEEVDFKPTRTSLVCNTLWFLSLSLSITCALLATLVEQWAREFIHKTQKRPSPVRRARVLSFLYFGLRRFGMHSVVDLIPMLLHISLMLFLGGLIAFLLPINHLMMGLISSFLTVFCAVYTTITILPIIRLDCPYRTPFSPLAWMILQTIRKTMSVLAHPLPRNSASHTIHDAMVSVALQATRLRDQRALTWTMASLTDDHELLPFLEAIPEAIHGIKGFHGLNNHLFMPLLVSSSKRRSLGHRITDTILSCRKMTPEDPVCQQRLITSMKALWALGMISDSSDLVDGVEGVYWFRRGMLPAIDEPPGWQAFWPRPYEQAARIAILYSQLNNMRNYIGYLIRLADDQPSKLREGVSHVMKHARDFDDWSSLFESSRTGLSVHFDSRDLQKINDMRVVLQLLSRDEIWEEATVTISCRFLLNALIVVDRGGTLPYQLKETCLKIISTYPTRSHLPRMDRVHIFNAVRVNMFDPLRHKVVPGKLASIDHIMRYLLRLLPALRREDVVLKFSVYLAGRNDLTALHFATEHCSLAYLSDVLVAVLVSIDHDMNVLNAIQAVLLLARFVLNLCSWNERDDQLWHYLTDHISEHKQILPLSTLMLQRKLYRLYFSTLTVDPSQVCKPDPDQIAEMHRLASHPLLSVWVKNSIHSQTYTAETYWELSHWVKAAMIVTLTGFLSACIEPQRSMTYVGQTANAICECLANSFEEVDVIIMEQFAKTWVALVNHLVSCPGDLQLQKTVRAVFLQFEGPVSSFYNRMTASIFEEALTLFLRFLQDQPEKDEYTMSRTKRALEILEARMAGDEVSASGQRIT